MCRPDLFRRSCEASLQPRRSSKPRHHKRISAVKTSKRKYKAINSVSFFVACGKETPCEQTISRREAAAQKQPASDAGRSSQQNCPAREGDYPGNWNPGKMEVKLQCASCLGSGGGSQAAEKEADLQLTTLSSTTSLYKKEET